MIDNKTSGRKKKIDIEQPTSKLYTQIRDKSYFLSLKPGYTMCPSPLEIISNNFIVKNLTIKNKSTQVFWRGVTDLRNLKAPLSWLIDIGETHIEVYPNDS